MTKLMHVLVTAGKASRDASANPADAFFVGVARMILVAGRAEALYIAKSVTAEAWHELADYQLVPWFQLAAEELESA